MEHFADDLEIQKTPKPDAGEETTSYTAAFKLSFLRSQPLAFHVIVSVFLLCSSTLPVCLAVQREQMPSLILMDDLFQNYSSLVTPRLDSSQSVDLTCLVNYISLLSLDNLDQEMTSQLLLSFSWTDELLRWSPQNYDNVSAIYPLAERLWRPGFSMLNQLSKTASVSESMDVASVLFTGFVQWSHTIILKTQCSLDMSRFPFDEQVCVIHVYLNRPTTEMRLADWSVVFSSNVQTNGEWEQVSISGSLQPKDFGVTFDTLYMEVKFKRLPRYYLINVLAPMLLLSCLCNVVFLVSAESGDKLTVALTLLLSESVFLSYTSSLMPKTSDELPILTLYLLCLLVVNTVSILATLLVLKAFKHSGKPDCPCPPNLLVGIWNVFGPKPEPDTLAPGVERDRNGGGGVSALTDQEMTNRRGGSLRALSEKLAHLTTLGWFTEKGAKYPNKVYPEKAVNEKESVITSGYASPAYTTETSLDLEESTRTTTRDSVPVYSTPLSDSTLVDLATENIYNDFRELCPENMRHKEASGKGQDLKPQSTPNAVVADNSNYQHVSWTSANKHSFASKIDNNSCRVACELNQTMPNANKTLDKGNNCEKVTVRDFTLEWLLISKALDRMFFLLFNILIGCVTVYFFAKAL